jgi:hypothetical protein
VPSDTVRITTFRADGWLDASDGAALVRVRQGPAQILVTVYQSLSAGVDSAPRLQVLRLTPDAPVQAIGAAPAPAAAITGAPIPASAAVVAHVQRVGDVAGQFGTWTGTRGSGSWIEGFAITPPDGLTPQDLEYQAVLGRGWLSPWIEAGKFCGSRGMALPLLGLNVRLTGNAAKTHECSYFATFVDGSSVGPVPAGEACQSDSLAALEAFQIVLRRRGVATAASAPQGPAWRRIVTPKAKQPSKLVARRKEHTTPVPQRTHAAPAAKGAPGAPAGRNKSAASVAKPKPTMPKRGTARSARRPIPKRPR